MKKVGLILCSGVFAAFFASPAFAMPAFKKSFEKRYSMEARMVTCDVCHVMGKDKKQFRNDYGNILAELLDAEQFKGDEKLEGDEADKVVFEALEKAGKQKAKDGKTYEEHIKGKSIPGLKTE
jgi:hypothetical protein